MWGAGAEVMHHVLVIDSAEAELSNKSKNHLVIYCLDKIGFFIPTLVLLYHQGTRGV